MVCNVAEQNKDKVEFKPEKTVKLVDTTVSCLVNYPGNVELNLSIG